MTTTTIPHGELRDGDLNWREGYLFRVEDLRRVEVCRECEAHGGHRPRCQARDEAGVRTLIRFRGVVVDASASIAGTGYDGGTYGAWAEVPATIEARR